MQADDPTQDDGVGRVGSLSADLEVVGLLIGLVLGAFLLTVGLRVGAPVWDVSRGHGVQGELLVQRIDCGKDCDYYGTFTSDDGGVVLTGVNLRYARGDRGEAVRAVSLLGDRTVVYARESNALLGAAALVVGQRLHCTGVPPHSCRAGTAIVAAWTRRG